jgi:nicotinate phosphoribosyltransferase
MRLPEYLPKSYFFTDDEMALFEVSATFAFCHVFHKKGMEKTIATFDLFVRDLPANRNFMLFGGLEEIIQYILKLRFTNQQMKVLQDNGLIGKELAAYLKKFKFSGSVCAMPEGTVFFPGEPIVRITAPIIEANLLYVALLNITVSNTVFLTKAIRTALVAGGKTLLTNGGRAQGMEAGSKFVRAAYLAGFTTTLQLSGVLKFNIPLPDKFLKSTFHAYIKAFPTELEAMLAFVEVFPNNEATLMLDTYNLETGLENAIKVCQKLKEKGQSIHSVFVDSGDLFQGAVIVRKRLNEAGFPNVKIILASNLNEYKVKALVDKGVPADSFMVITELATSADDPKLEVVYKMAEIDDGKSVRQTMKLAPGKKSLPGKKQVYRVEEGGKFKKDIIGLEEDSIAGKGLLVPMIEKGKLIYLLPRLEDIRQYIKDQVTKLPDKYKKLEVQDPPYLVEISPKLQNISEKVQKTAH